MFKDITDREGERERRVIENVSLSSFWVRSPQLVAQIRPAIESTHAHMHEHMHASDNRDEVRWAVGPGIDSDVLIKF